MLGELVEDVGRIYAYERSTISGWNASGGKRG